MGELMRRKWLSVDAYVSLFSTWDTPGLISPTPMTPQFPVASEYLRPLVMVSLLMAAVTLMSLPLSTQRCAYPLASLVSFLYRPLKRPASSGPPRSSLLLA